MHTRDMGRQRQRQSENKFDEKKTLAGYTWNLPALLYTKQDHAKKRQYVSASTLTDVLPQLSDFRQARRVLEHARLVQSCSRREKKNS